MASPARPARAPSTLVQRMREGTWYDTQALFNEGADEIERLRAALQGVLDLFHQGQITVRLEAAGYVQAAVEVGEEALGS